MRLTGGLGPEAQAVYDGGNRAPKVRDPGMKVVSVKIGPYRWILR